MGDKAAIFPPAARHDHVIGSIGSAEAVTQFLKFAFPVFPVDPGALVFGIAASAAYAGVIKRDARPLIGHYAIPAEHHLGGQLIFFYDVLSLQHSFCIAMRLRMAVSW